MTVQVHGAVLVNVSTKRVLLAQRPPTKEYPWFWESPGGKAEPGERIMQTIFRELREELTIIPRDLYGFDELTRYLYRFVYPDGGCVTLWPMLVRNDARIIPREGQGFGWFTPEEMNTLTLTPCNVAARRSIEKFIHTMRYVEEGA